MEMILVKFNDMDLLVEDMQTVELIKSHSKEILALRELSNSAMNNFMDLSYAPKLKQGVKDLKAKFAEKFVFGYPFDARSGALFALDKKISYIEINLDLN